MKICIYKYLDYRHFLSDLFSELSKEDLTMSFRKFAKICGSTSPNYLQLIRDRKLNIQDDSVELLSKYLDMKKKELNYFKTIIEFDHAKENELKDDFFRKILNTREYQSIYTLTNEQYQFFSHWYIPVIRELITHPNCNNSVEFIENRISPPVSAAKIQKAINLLIKLNLIQKNCETGFWEQNDRVMSTPSEVLSIAILKYHKDTIRLASESIDRYKKCDRDIRSVTIGLSDEQFNYAKMRFESFWKEIMDLGNTNQKTDRVYQINMQLFPLSNRIEE